MITTASPLILFSPSTDSAAKPVRRSVLDQTHIRNALGERHNNGRRPVGTPIIHHDDLVRDVIQFFATLNADAPRLTRYNPLHRKPV